MSLTVVILTLNEERHIGRAIASVSPIAEKILVIDSGSTDSTIRIARENGAETLTHSFITQAQQFNWALGQLPDNTEWVLRLDADEVVSPELARTLARALPNLGPNVAGARVSRRIAFLGRQIRWGGIFPVRITRILRHGRGWSEDRWMDEHILLHGEEVQLEGELIDDNLKPLSWWIDKHNNYASREVIETLDAEYGFLGREFHHVPLKGSAGFKRWLKEEVYFRLPLGFRASAYFLYRYVIRLGFLDGKEGRAFHFLQGFWYRYLVDLKLHEVKTYMARENVDVVTAIRKVLQINVGSITPHAAK